ncbi:zf-HC2 domain-containing protein [Wenjunlia tyrosinilytica]|uniref:Putative zinc-finger domain-containing protein n=1 Tax=Wenjunlia tyrosinilytica TaxID=1544741 RepID=A0A918DSS3_9ACTN|nr:zf-HC2 domain-containing protein [Wenjunlia tyrosinilytica]GGO81373.1 hypothetical protein GCM10012280_05440 [Wenjunlia tyrosinilytica]
MNDLTCAEVRDLGAELALGVLPGRERALAIAHLDHCPACREEIEQMTLIGDGLLGLLPGTEPPVGFESRVLAGLNVPARRSARRRFRMAFAAVAAAAAIALGFGGWTLATTVLDQPAATSQSALVSAHLTKGAHQVGEIFAHPGSPGWVYMHVDFDDGSSGKVTCQLIHHDGSTVNAGSFTMKDGYGYWAAPSHSNPSDLSGARLLAADGSVLATAHFPKT